MKEDLVWYAAYGSNLNKDRLMCYIKGGSPKFSNIQLKGCTDDTPPQSIEPHRDDYEMYFAKYSEKWGGGVCFIRSDRDFTLFNLYLVTEDQFRELALQECGLDRSYKTEVDIRLSKSDHEFTDEGWYGKVLYMGESDGYPIYTVTSSSDLTDDLKQPSRAYLYHIIEGLVETHGLDKRKIHDYLREKKGMEDVGELKKALEMV